MMTTTMRPLSFIRQVLRPATLGLALLGVSSLVTAQTTAPVPASAASVLPPSHLVMGQKTQNRDVPIHQVDAKPLHHRPGSLQQQYDPRSGVIPKMRSKNRSDKYPKAMVMGHDMQCMTMEHGKESSKTPAVGSLPRSDGAAPGDYASYGVTLKLDENPLLAKVQFDTLETVHSSRGVNTQQWDGRFWVGHDFNKLWIRSEGTRSQNRLEEGDIEALWGHAISPFWDGMVGIRHDLGIGPARNWAALGIQGIAPYEFEFAATLYAGSAGRSAFRLITSQDWLFTQRLILTPELEFNAYGHADPQRDLGAGIANVSMSLRLRYEFSRKFAPYIGYSWVRTLGGTAGMARAAGRPVTDRLILAGVRVWF